MKRWILMAVVMLLAGAVQAKPGFTGQDFSGVYDCTGDDAHEGKYKGTVTLTLNRNQSVGQYGAYDFKLEVPDFGVYLGEAAADGHNMALHFALTDQKTRDYGTGIATVRMNKQGRLSFRKFYYEPEYKGGNHGTEDCVRR